MLIRETARSTNNFNAYETGGWQQKKKVITENEPIEHTHKKNTLPNQIDWNDVIVC